MCTPGSSRSNALKADEAARTHAKQQVVKFHHKPSAMGLLRQPRQVACGLRSASCPRSPGAKSGTMRSDVRTEESFVYTNPPSQWSGRP